jgi:gas vesicle protein
MKFDITNFVSGLIGGVIGASASLLAAYLQHQWNRDENEKQRAHEQSLQRARERHDKDMQRREENIRKTGIASRREIGGG